MAKKEIVIFGASGQLGRELQGRYARRSDVLLRPLSHQDIDLCDAGALSRLFQSAKPWAIINCSAYNAVEAAEAEPEKAFATNAAALVLLATHSAKAGSLLVHFSTDYVFDGKSTEPYREESPPSPLNFYGLSKFSGEQVVRLLHRRHCLIRTCGVYSRHRSPGGKQNFIDSILAQAREGRTPHVVSDLKCTPTSAAELADVVERLVDLEAIGTFHATNGGECSWHEFAVKVLEFAELRCDVVPTRFEPGAGRAVRPAYTVLSNDKVESVLGRPMSHWQDALRAHMRGITQ